MRILFLFARHLFKGLPKTIVLHLFFCVVNVLLQLIHSFKHQFFCYKLTYFAFAVIIFV